MGQGIRPILDCQHGIAGFVWADDRLQHQIGAGSGGHKPAGHAQQFAQRHQVVFQQLAQIGGRQQAAVQLAQPGDLVAVLPIDQPVHNGLGDAEDQLAEDDDRSDHAKEDHIAREAQDNLYLGDDENGGDDEDGDDRPAHKEAQQAVAHDAVRGEHAEVGHRIADHQQHKADGDVAQQGEQQHADAGIESRGQAADRDQIREDAHGGRNKAEQQVGHAPAAGLRQTALARLPDVAQRQQTGDDIIDGKERKERPRLQIVERRRKVHIAHDQLAEQRVKRADGGEEEGKPGQPAPAANAEVSRHQHGQREEIGRGG